MASSMCFFRNPLPWIAILVPIFVCAGFSGYGLLSILFFTALVLILSSIFFTFSKQKPVLVEKSVKDEEALSQNQECLAQVEQVVSELEPERETKTQQKETQEGGADQIHDYLVKSPHSFSESESIDHSSTSDDSEVDWPYSGNVVQSPDCSDDSISDEESLIEIALPSGHYVGPKEDEPKSNLLKKFPDFSSTESLLRQPSLMELFAEINEMNEEENLIEIDISMGSIKCSRFEIEA
uniref:Putative myelin transcription factor 1-like protein n=1 Tax=Davidia involucrata TaxID=16924 RepID=A0A5B6YL57_DAVIN